MEWKLVPVEPDDMMKKEAKKCVTGTGGAGRALRSSEQIFTEQNKAALAAAPTPPVQEDEPVAMVYHHKSGAGIGGTKWKHLPHGTNLYTHPDDKLRKAAEKVVAICNREYDSILDFQYELIPAIETLRAALEGK